ncbi:SPOR domain-containing protein [bacterium]|nr:SPOR domain-containing protein [candidate division CSSED10-310 bacterium]
MAESYELTRRHLHIIVVSAVIIIVLVLMLGIVIGKNISLPQKFPSAEDLAQNISNDPNKLGSAELKNLRSTSDESSTKPHVEDEGYSFYEKFSQSEQTESTTTVVESFSALQTQTPKVDMDPAVDTGDQSLPASPTPDIYATAPPDFVLAYVVQTSSVGNREFAETSVRKLLKKGYPAYISKIKFKTGKENYRVRIGPYESKAAAEEIFKRVKAELKNTPLLMTVKKGDR